MSDSSPSSTRVSTAQTSPFTSPIQSYLNNDGIDQLIPTVRKHRVSSLSLSDLSQWQNGLTRLTSPPNSSANLRKTDSLVKLSRDSSIIRRRRKSVIDHTRVASYAFCFDIDGVIVKGPDTIPEARQALKMLNGDNPYNIKVPSIFVTNGGGRSESKRAKELSERLEMKITPDQVIQGHTPMKDLVNVHKNVLVVGGLGDSCRAVAEEYGFENIYIPLDILKWNPSVSPYHTLTEEELKVARDYDFSKIGIDAILVFADSRNWAVDQQIILELLLSKNGVMGTASESFQEGPELFFAHSDFIWATNYNLSRYGMGALQVSVAALYREHTGKELTVTRFGKPQKGTFKYAEKVLSSWRKDCLEEHVEKATLKDGGLFENDDGEIVVQDNMANKNYSSVFDSSDGEDEPEEDNNGVSLETISQINLELPPASTVYFVGDTPESDIRFANSHDASWYSILVKTGVYQEGTIPKYTPKHTCGNVLDAVKFAIEREHQKELQEWNGAATATSKNEPLVQGETLEVPIDLSEQLNIIKDIQITN